MLSADRSRQASALLKNPCLPQTSLCPDMSQTKPPTASKATHRGQAVQQAAHRVAAAQRVACKSHRIRFRSSCRRQQLAVQRLLRGPGNAGQGGEAAGTQHLQRVKGTDG